MIRMAGAAAAAAMLLAGPAPAGPLPAGGVTAAEVAKALQAKGYKAEIGKDQQGDPMVTSALDGSNFRVVFYNCKGGPRCTDVAFATAFDLEQGATLDKINGWNRKNRYGRAYLDDEADPYLEYDVDFEVGATSEAVENAIERWASVIPSFKKYMNE
jgi:hypothetical protein